MAARPICDCIHAGDFEKAKQLINEGHDVNERDSSGRTPTILAARTQQPALMSVLLAKHADTNLQDTDDAGATIFAPKTNARRTALIEAVITGNAQICEMLLDHGADVNIADKLHRTPLIHACMSQNTQIV